MFGRPEIAHDKLEICVFNQDVLRFDVPMRDTDLIQIKQTPKHLEGKHLNFQSWHFCPFATVLLNRFVQIQVEIVHNDIQVFLIVLISIKAILHSKSVRMVESLEDLQFSVFIFLVLVDPLDGDDL